MNNIKLNIIKILLVKDIFDRYSTVLDSVFSGEEDTYKIYLSIKDYYSVHDKDLSSVDNLEICYESAYPVQTKANKELTNMLFDKLRTLDADPSLVETYIKTYQRQNRAHELALQAIRITEGKEPTKDLADLAQHLYEDREVLDTSDSLIVTDTLSELFESTVSGESGLKWRLECLNQSLGPLRVGDFGFVFKRPETGGTTFLASEGSYMIDQMDKPLLWINNEEAGKKVKLRFIQAYFGVTISELQKNLKDYEETFIRKVGDKLVIRDDFHSDISHLARYIEDIKPGLIFVDQLDKLSGKLVVNSDRRDLEHGLRYRWGREIAKQYAPVIGVSQAAATAENRKWLSMDDVAESKTSKAAEADWMMGIGAIQAMGQEVFRFLSICKNKLVGSEDTNPELRHGRMTTIIQPQLARYIDV